MFGERFYHVYPLGFTGANQNSNDGKTVQALSTVVDLVPHLVSLNTTTLLLGPIFESLTHGYDTVAYDRVDQRLGTNEDLKILVQACHKGGIKVMLDCVFNHVSRKHWIFEDVLKNRESSPYCSWIADIDFNGNSDFNDGFSYGRWDGHGPLVKLNLSNPAVGDYLTETALSWVDQFDIDGLRMDAADVMDRPFLKRFSNQLRDKKVGFMVVGEVVHGDYNRWMDEGGLDAVTNYEAFKGLYSSLNDANYYEIGYALNRQFGPGGIYQGKKLYNFVDNHDVSRVASNLKNEAHLYPLYIMLYTMPGMPSIYYGSEFGMKGEKGYGSDEVLRPSWAQVPTEKRDLYDSLKKLSAIHKEQPALQGGGYQQIHIDHQVIGYKRQWDGQDVYVFINSKEDVAEIPVPMVHGEFYDLLNDEALTCDGRVGIYGNWGRVLIHAK